MTTTFAMTAAELYYAQRQARQIWATKTDAEVSTALLNASSGGIPATEEGAVVLCSLMREAAYRISTLAEKKQELKRRGREYGKASAAVGDLRAQLARNRQESVKVFLDGKELTEAIRVEIEAKQGELRKALGGAR